MLTLSIEECSEFEINPIFHKVYKIDNNTDRFPTYQMEEKKKKKKHPREVVSIYSLMSGNFFG